MNYKKYVMLAAFLPFTFNITAQAKSETDEPALEFVFEEMVYLGKTVVSGKTVQGDRKFVPISGGTFEGTKIKGTILSGGGDWQLQRADGCVVVDADYMLKTDDGVVINLRYDGGFCFPTDGSALKIRTFPKFNAPIGKYDWLNKSPFIATLNLTKGPDGNMAVVRRIYQIK